MKIAVLTSLYPSPPRPREGIFAERRWCGMRERGHQVRVVHPVPRVPPLVGGTRGEYRQMPEGEDRRGISVARPRYLHLPGGALGNARRFAAAGVENIFAHGVAGGAPDVVVLDYAWPAAAAAEALAANGVPVVVNGRGSDVLQVREEPALRDALAAGLRAAGHWCAVSQDLVEAMDELGGSSGTGALAPNGVDVDFFKMTSGGPIRGVLEVEKDRKVVLVVGHLIERKDPLLAARAFAAGAPEDALLCFAGRGPLQDALQTEIRRLGLTDRTRMLGELAPAELRDWYAVSDAVLLCSSREGRPNVVLEALSCGRPIVATRAGGTAELLEGLDSLLVDEREPAAIGAALRAVLDDPPNPGELRGHVEPLTWEAGLTALEACLERAAGAGASA